ncbi:hypothetical protein LAZ67_20001079 [Cordylochernes scorpioides]|uniref:RNA-directed DNA polymerase n=1 Tax=Cordylochernes scorpioides TaxID=51811 RepID=A0ABY6LJN1_9ARAC|nr:hypothetical protein LAZ67_20001079 [Cordylochernes scorpioides]
MPGHRKRRQFKQTDALRGNVGATRVTSARVDRHTLDHSISTRTISCHLVANGLHSCRPLRRLPLTPPNRRQRLEWCRARSTWMTEWHRVVFSDESRFCLSSDSRRVRVWRRRGERSNPAAIVERPTVRQRGIMVWGAIAYDSRSPLLRIQGTMTAQRYVDDVLRPVTLPYLQGVPNALYQQDNARPHTARISQQALQDVQMLPWPPYSPDLSPIEHVWDIIGRRLHALPQPRSEDELWQMVEREWRAIPQDAIRTLFDSLPRRVAACIAVRAEVLKKFGIRPIFVGSRSIGQIVRHPITKSQVKTEPSDQQNAVYSLSCQQCTASYVGETGRTVGTRVKEHIRNLIEVASRNIPNDAIVEECRKELLLERELTAPSSVISLTSNRADSVVIEDNQLCILADCNKVETEAKHSEDPKISDFFIDDSLDESQKEKLRNLFKNYRDIFEFSKRKQFKDVNVKHRISTGDHILTKQRPYRVAQGERQIIQDERERERIDDILDCLQGAKFYSSMDLQSGYWQIDVEESAREKTAFITPDGLYEFKVMPFGLCNAPATFERMINNLLKGLKWTICLCYLDDIIVFSDDFEEHPRRLQLKAGLCLNSTECKFGAKTITVLGHEVSKNGICPDQEEIRAAHDFATPSQPLKDLLKKDSAFNWNQEEQNAFEALKSALIPEPALGHFDYSSPTEIHTDASNYGIGAVLVPIQKEKERAIAYASRTLNKAEKYSTTERECLAIIWAINKFRPYVFRQPFTIVTDHHSLCWLTNLKDPCGRLARWALWLQDFDVTVVYKAWKEGNESGRKHQDADCLSRSPLSCSEDIEKDIPSLMALQNFGQEQMKDPDLMKIAVKIQQDTSNKSFLKIDNTLYKKKYDPMGRIWLLVVPRHLRPEILKNIHYSSTAGHLGFTKTYDRIRKKFYWPGMYRNVRRHVAHCQDCQRRKRQPQLPTGHLLPIAGP